MMELYTENSADLNFNVKLTMELEELKDVIVFGSGGSDSGHSDGNPLKQRSQANARERFRTHRFVDVNLRKFVRPIKKLKRTKFPQCQFGIQHIAAADTHRTEK